MASEPIGKFWISLNIVDVGGPAFKRGAGSTALPSGRYWMLRYPLLKLRRKNESDRHPQAFAVETEDERPVRPAQPDRTLGNCFEHSVKIEGRSADNVEKTSAVAVCCPSDCLSSLQQPRVLDGDDRPGAAKFWTNEICLSVNGRTSCKKRANTPISSRSLTIGTARTVRAPPSSTAATVFGSEPTM